MKKENPSVQSVDRALQLLQLIAESTRPLSVGELGEQLNMNRTTAWRLVGTLENHGFVERDPLTKGYRLGFSAERLASQASHYDSLIRRAHQSMEQLGQETEEAILLSVPKSYGTLTIHQTEPAQSVRLVDYVNAFLPLHCTSNGKLLLSMLPPEELAVLIEQPLEKLTPFTITDRKQLLEEIEKVRNLGIGTAIGELDENENGISAPIFDKGKNLIAFISVCGPSFRFTKGKVEALTDRMRIVAQEISDLLD